jgi:hypothetical protein
MMNSELGIVLPFVFGMFAVWSITRVILVRLRSRGSAASESDARIAELTMRINQLEQSLEATTNEVQRLVEAERFTAQLLEARAGAGRAT